MLRADARGRGALPLSVAPALARGEPAAWSRLPAGLYTPFQRVQDAEREPQRCARAAEADRRRSASTSEPVTNAEFLDFVTVASRVAQVADQGRCSPTAAISGAGRPISRSPTPGRARRAGDQRLLVRRRSLLQRAGPAAADDGSMGIRARRRRARPGRSARALARMVRRAESAPAAPRSAPAAPTASGSATWSGLVWEWTLDFDAYATTASRATPTARIPLASAAAPRPASPTRPTIRPSCAIRCARA